MNRARRFLLQHPLAAVFASATESITTALHPDTARHYRGTARNFLIWLGAEHPDISRLEQLRRDPHLLGWLARCARKSRRLLRPPA